jgi:hypothetical protein
MEQEQLLCKKFVETFDVWKTTIFYEFFQLITEDRDFFRNIDDCIRQNWLLLEFVRFPSFCYTTTLWRKTCILPLLYAIVLVLYIFFAKADSNDIVIKLNLMVILNRITQQTQFAR